MIDTHCHIIPGVDDGSPDVRTSMDMAVTAAGDGIRTIVATPHVHSEALPFAKIRLYAEALTKRFTDTGIPVAVVPGGEVASFVPIDIMTRFTINGNGYILYEFPHTHIPVQSMEKLKQLVDLGHKIVLAHPERNPSVIKNPKILKTLIAETGARVQITANSVTGAFGKVVQACARRLIKKGWVHIIASDAHAAVGFRSPVLSEALAVAEKIMGKEKALKLVMDNPLAMIEGRVIDP